MRLSFLFALGSWLVAVPVHALAAAPADTLCDHPIQFWTTITPPHPCALQAVSLVIHDCKVGDHVLSGTYDNGTFVSLEFVSKSICERTSPCVADSLVVPLGPFWPGEHQVKIWSRTVVKGA